MQSKYSFHRRVASEAIISAFVLECGTAICFLQIHVQSTKSIAPNTHEQPPIVDIRSFQSATNEASQNRPKKQSSGLSPTKQRCARFLVWRIYDIHISTKEKKYLNWCHYRDLVISFYLWIGENTWVQYI